ncbi:MAG: hypothetical protein ACTSWQ_00970 [Candidatus Thorarchaeota archaeon]
MATFVVQLDFNDAGGWQTITSSTKLSNFKRKRQIHNKLKPTSNTCSFTLINDVANVNKLLGNTGVTDVYITKDGSPYFRGRVRNNFKITLETRLTGAKIECVDYGLDLKRKITSTFRLANYKVSDTVSTSTSLVHYLLTEAGFSAGAIQPDDINKTISSFVNISGDTTYWKALEELLGEFGFVFYFDESGNFKTFELFPSSIIPTYTFDNDNMIGTLKVDRKETEKEGVNVKWWPLVTEDDVIVFSDTTNGSATWKCDITVAPDDFYPATAGDDDTYATYQFDGREIVEVNNAVADVDDTGLTQITFTNEYQRAKIAYENQDVIDHHIYQFDITGDCTYKGDEYNTEQLFIASTEKIKDITSKYITTSADAKLLATGTSQWYQYGDFQYILRSKDVASPGAYAYIDETEILTMNPTCRILSATDNEEIGEISYVLEGVTEYVASTTTDHQTVAPPPPLPPAKYLPVIVDRPTYTEIITGFDDTTSGGTTTPAKPSILFCLPTSDKAITLIVDKQEALTNFSHLEIQVSDDDSTWYSIPTTPPITDWKDTLNDTTDIYNDAAVFTQSNIPNTGEEDNPEGQLLYYRVRRVTQTASESLWSNSATTTSAIISSGDIGAATVFTNQLVTNAVTADKIDINVLNAIVANINEYLTIGDSGWQSGGIDNTTIVGATRAYLDDNELTIEECATETLVWTATGDLNTERRNSYSIGSQSASLTSGGVSDTGNLDTTEIFNGSSWTASHNLPVVLRLQMGAGTIYSALNVGGLSDSTNLDTTYTYNGAAWSLHSANLSVYRTGGASAGTASAALRFGGSDGVSGVGTEKFDGSSWSSAGNINQYVTYNGGDGSLNNAISVAGNNSGDNNETELYNGTSWSVSGDLIASKRFGLGTTGTGTTAIAFGGMDSTGDPTEVTEMFNGSSWSATTAMNTARYYTSGTGTKTAGLCIGGWDEVNALATTEKAVSTYTWETKIKLGSVNVDGDYDATIAGDLDVVGDLTADNIPTFTISGTTPTTQGSDGDWWAVI